jgi:hypothetical protein
MDVIKAGIAARKHAYDKCDSDPTYPFTAPTSGELGGETSSSAYVDGFA